MLVNADFKSLEVVVAAFLSKDPVLCEEMLTFVDIHAVNQKAFNLPDRRTAKLFVFRLLYGGSAYSYANDPEFFHVSRSEKYWQSVIDRFFEKYAGIKKWHEKLLQEAMTTGKIQMPHGRFYPIEPNYSKKEPWPLTIIKNYPVQGFGADLVMLARLECRSRLRAGGYKSILVSTVHDSIVADCPEEEWKDVARLMYDSIIAVPELCRKLFRVDFDLPTTSEILVGKNMSEMTEIKFK